MSRLRAPRGLTQAAGLGIFVALTFEAAALQAQSPLEERSVQRFARAVKSLEDGATNAAIAELEAISDDGFHHPDVSYNRGVAYAQRARTAAARPGDLGKAAAGFAETLNLRPGDDAARRSLKTVRATLARRRARAGGEPVMVNPSLTRSALALVGEDGWSVVAAVGSLGLSVGLLLRRPSSPPSRRLVGGITAGIATLLLALGLLAAITARQLRQNWAPAVVVVPEARLLDAQGIPLQGGPRDAIPEGETLHVGTRQGRLIEIEWGETRGWVARNQLRTLARVE